MNADGCATNVAASKLISEKLGWLSLSRRYVSNAAHGSVDRMVNSKTMNIKEISEFLLPFRTIQCHFQLSRKSLALLRKALDILSIKYVHLITFSLTRLCYLLIACKQVDDLLVPIYDVLATADIRKEECNYLISPKRLTIIYMLADLEPLFLNHYLQKLDGDCGLITECFQVSQDFAQKISDCMHNKINKFLKCLYEDQNGNVMAKVHRSDRSEHDITLKFSHQLERVTVGSKFDSILSLAAEIKESMMINVNANFQDHCQTDILLVFAFALDFCCLIGLEDHFKLLKKLHSLYDLNYIHTTEEMQESEWKDFTVNIKYEANIQYDEKIILQEFRNLWPVINQI